MPTNEHRCFCVFLCVIVCQESVSSDFESSVRKSVLSDSVCVEPCE